MKKLIIIAITMASVNAFAANCPQYPNDPTPVGDGFCVQNTSGYSLCSGGSFISTNSARCHDKMWQIRTNPVLGNPNPVKLTPVKLK